MAFPRAVPHAKIYRWSRLLCTSSSSTMAIRIRSLLSLTVNEPFLARQSRIPTYHIMYMFSFQPLFPRSALFPPARDNPVSPYRPCPTAPARRWDWAPPWGHCRYPRNSIRFPGNRCTPEMPWAHRRTDTTDCTSSGPP